MNKTYTFTGTITAVQPITMTIKGCNGLPRNGNGADALPYLPASTLRGAIRHATHWIGVDKQDAGNGEKFDVADHFLLAQGTDIVGNLKLDADGAIDANNALRENNPMLSLFGFWGLKSRAEIGPGLLTTPNAYGMFGGGARTIMFERSPELMDLLDDGQVDRLKNILREQAEASLDISEIKAQKKALTAKLKNASKEEQAALYDQMNKLEVLIDQRKDAKSEARESIRRPLDQYEAFAAGAEFAHHMTMSVVSEVELGMFLAGLGEFAREPFVGGHRAHNCGRIKASWQVTTWSRGEDAPTVVGTVSFDENGFHVEGDDLKEARAQFKAAVLNFKRA